MSVDLNKVVDSIFFNSLRVSGYYELTILI
jgi:hypothetical protein